MRAELYVIKRETQEFVSRGDTFQYKVTLLSMPIGGTVNGTDEFEVFHNDSMLL